MQRHHADFGEPRGGSNCTGNSVGDVVKFEVEEDSEAELCELLDGFGALGREELAAYLENACCPSKSPRQDASRPGAVNIKGDD